MQTPGALTAAMLPGSEDPHSPHTAAAMCRAPLQVPGRHWGVKRPGPRPQSLRREIQSPRPQPGPQQHSSQTHQFHPTDVG